MKTPGDYFAFLLALAIFIALGFAIYFGIKLFIGQFNILETDTVAQLIIISIILLICSFIIASAIKGSRSIHKTVIPSEKSILYLDFINSYANINKGNNEEIKSVSFFHNGIALWAGKDVLKSYTRFINYTDKINNNNDKLFNLAEKVILEMRKDIGIQNYGLRNGDLNKIIFKDIDIKQFNNSNDINKKS